MNMPDTAVTLGAFRCCEHGHGITYRARMESAGPHAIAVLLAAAERHNLIPAHDHDPAACTCHVLDLLDSAGDIVADQCLPEHAWTWWQAAAGLIPVQSDCRTCQPAAWQATDPTRRTLAA